MSLEGDVGRVPQFQVSFLPLRVLATSQSRSPVSCEPVLLTVRAVRVTESVSQSVSQSVSLTLLSLAIKEGN